MLWTGVQNSNRWGVQNSNNHRGTPITIPEEEFFERIRPSPRGCSRCVTVCCVSMYLAAVAGEKAVLAELRAIGLSFAASTGVLRPVQAREVRGLA